MARFKRRGFRRTGFKRKRRFGGRKRAGGRVFKRKVKRVVDSLAEKKYVDKTDGIPCTNAGAFIYLMDTVAQGDTKSTREGASIRLKSIKINLLATAATDVTHDDSYFRIIIGCWRDFYVTSPAIARILESPTSQTLSPYNRENLQAKKWIPMYDKKFTLDRLASGGARPNDRTWTVSFSGKRLPLKKITYDLNGNADHVYFIWVQSSWVGLEGEPQIAYYARCTFVDY